MEKPSEKDVELVREIMKHKGKMVLDSEQFMLIKTTLIPLPKVVSLSNLLELAQNSMIRIQETYNKNTNKCYDNPEFLKCSELLQEVLSSLSYYDFSLERSEMIKEIEQYEKDFKIIEIFSEVSTDLLKIRDDTECPGMQGENIKSLNTLLSYLVHTAEDDRDLCYKIAQLPEFLKAASEKLGQWREPYFSRRSEQLTEGEDIIELLCRLLYIVTMFEENIQRIRDVKCIEVMTPYLNCDDNGIRLLSLAVLSNIANAPEIQTLKSNDDIIKYLVWAVSMALKTECEVWDIWSLTELAKIVKQVARNDTNRGLLVQHGVVPLLVEIAEQGETDEQYGSVESGDVTLKLRMADFDAFESSAPEGDLEDPAAGFLADQDKELAELEDDNFGEDSTAQPVQQQQDDLGMFNGQTDTQQTNYDSYENFEEAPQTNGPSDAFSAITQQDQIRAEPEKIRIWREEQQDRLEQKDKEEEQKKIDMRESAKKELDDWYKHNAEQLEKTKENNRASEAAFVKERDETQPGGEWEKICRLCEFNPKNSKNMKDVSRFRSILLQLKQTPLVR